MRGAHATKALAAERVEMRVSDEEDGRETPLLERPPSEHAIERLKIFAVGSLGVALILAGLLTYRVLGIAECRARSLRWRDPYHVLITGFEPFANFSDNPTQHVARLLDKSCAAGVCFHAHVLSVDERGMARAEALLGEGPGVGAEGTWDAAIHLGYEDSARGLKLETIAKNIGAGSHAVRPMAGEPYKETPCDGARPVAPGETCLLPTTAPLNLLNLPILAEGIASASAEIWSRDAGNYFCNELYYRSLRIARSSQAMALTPVVFVHMPPLSANLSAGAAASFVGALSEALLLHALPAEGARRR